jgi:DNA-binding beta-propeller fold protein YncE
VGSWLSLLLAAGLATTLASAAPAAAAIEQRIAWGSKGSGAGQFSYPAGVETDSAGHVYVADTGNDRMQKFSASGGFLLGWGWGVKDGQSELQTCRSSCQRGIYGPGEGQLNAPNGVAPDPAGHVYVADTGEDRIQKFSPSGRFLDKWGSTGSGPGKFDAPVDVAVGPAGQVYVADFSNLRIQRFARGGRFLGQWAAPYPYGLATDSSGHVYVAEYYDDRVEKFSPEGRFLRMWGWGVKTGRSRFERCGPPRVACSPGIDGSGDGQFFFPDGIATDSAGHVYVVDAVNFRIVKYAQIPPQTTITAAKIRSGQRRAEFGFKSSESGSKFRCRLDHRDFRRCGSPKVYRHLRAGQHTFRVRATDADKLTDPTPAKKRFWITK